VSEPNDRDLERTADNPKPEALANNLFALVMAGVFAVIVFMIIMGGW